MRLFGRRGNDPAQWWCCLLLAGAVLWSSAAFAQTATIGMKKLDGSESATPQTSYLSGDVTNNTLALAASGLSMTVEAGGKYGFNCTLFVAQATSANGLAFDFGGGTATASVFRASSLFFDNSALKGAVQSTALSTVGSVSAAGNNPGHLLVSGAMEPATSGTVVPRFANYAGTYSPTSPASTAYVLAVAADNSAIYLMCSSKVLWKYTTSTGTWSNLGSWISATGSIATDPVTPATVYVSTNGGRSGSAGYLHRSTDAGSTWTAVGTGLSTWLARVVINPVTPAILYGVATTGNSGFYKSTDSGANWALSNTGLPVEALSTAIAIDPTTPSTLYIASSVSADGLYKSTDSGANWALSNTGSNAGYVSSLVVDPATPTTLFVSGDTAPTPVYRSTDAGATWAASSTGLDAAGTVYSVAVDASTSPHTMYASTSAGANFYRSTDGGASWATSNTGLPGSFYATNIQKPVTSGFIYGSFSNQGVYFSADRAVTWLKLVNWSPILLKRGSNCTISRAP